MATLEAGGNAPEIEAPAWLPRLLGPGYLAVRRFLRPFVLIQLCAGTLLAGYLMFPAVREACGTIARLNQQGGVLFAGAVGALAGGVLPEVAKRLTVRGYRWTRPVLADAAFAVGYFFLLAMIVYLLYQLQGRMFGDDGRFVTSMKKMAFDQFFYVVIVGTPFGMTLYSLWRFRFHVGEAWRALTGPGFVERYLTLLLPTWAFWIPMNLITYTLPVQLQFAMFSLALAAWGLILAWVATPPDADPIAAP